MHHDSPVYRRPATSDLHLTAYLGCLIGPIPALLLSPCYNDYCLVTINFLATPLRLRLLDPHHCISAPSLEFPEPYAGYHLIPLWQLWRLVNC